MSSTGVGQRLYILLSVLVTLAPPVGFFLIRGAEDTLLNAILKECQGDNFRLFSVCFDKAYRESYLMFWQYLLPFFPAVFIACARWVVGIPRPLFALSGSRLYLIGEGFFVLVGVLVTVNAVYDAAVNPIDKLFVKHFFTRFYLALAALGTPFILSMLFERPRAELSFKIVRLSIFIVLVAPFVEIAIIIFRQPSGS